MFDMRLERLSLYTRIVTVLTLQWFLSGVCHVMLVEVELVAEGFATVRLGTGVAVGVGGEVRPQVPLPPVRSTAPLAAELLLHRVYRNHVILQSETQTEIKISNVKTMRAKRCTMKCEFLQPLVTTCQYLVTLSSSKIEYK